MSTKPIRRITLFKVPKPEDQQALLGKYRTMPERAVKVGSFSSEKLRLVLILMFSKLGW